MSNLGDKLVVYSVYGVLNGEEYYICGARNLNSEEEACEKMRTGKLNLRHNQIARFERFYAEPEIFEYQGPQLNYVRISGEPRWNKVFFESELSPKQMQQINQKLDEKYPPNPHLSTVA